MTDRWEKIRGQLIREKIPRPRDGEWTVELLWANDEPAPPQFDALRLAFLNRTPIQHNGVECRIESMSLDEHWTHQGARFALMPDAAKHWPAPE